MKKVLLLINLLAFSLVGYAQFFNQYTLETVNYIMRGGSINGSPTETEKANELYNRLCEANGGELSFSKEIPVEGKSADEIFNMLRSWAMQKFTNSQCNIYMTDKELHTIILQGFVSDVESTGNLTTVWKYSLTPKIILETEEGLARATVMMETYSVNKKEEHGLYFTSTTINQETTPVKSLYPFDQSDVFKHTHAHLFNLAVTACGLYMAAIENLLLPADYGYGAPTDDAPCSYIVTAAKGAKLSVLNSDEGGVASWNTEVLAKGSVVTAWSANAKSICFYRNGKFCQIYIVNSFTFKPLPEDKMPVAKAEEQPAGRIVPLQFWEVDRRMLNFGR